MTTGAARHSPAPQPHLSGGHGSSHRYSMGEKGRPGQGVKNNFKHISIFGVQSEPDMGWLGGGLRVVIIIFTLITNLVQTNRY